MIIFFLLLCGCIEEEKNNTDDNNGNDEDTIPDYEKNILGNWTGYDIFENFTYITDYNFYSNNSYFSGFKEIREDSYNMTRWGTYNIDDENIEFIVSEENSSINYSITSEGNLLTLYYDDGTYLELLKMS